MTEHHHGHTPECSELTTDQLDQVSGGVVCITHPPEPCFNAGAGSVAGTGGQWRPGKVDFEPVSFNRKTDKSSPLF